ncbi:hypothetical protein CAMGR0001_1482 [Campylobacter gracilis RM3268]|uniref:Uncharacterized protein n=1 Tax=Campylobacter gracilis RM3268 TaxID=553220 RepID=C8PJT2_9BACT|nr:hypothetical protein CAMGR0001_1482 [Campylobacter gracilis RM3268]
MAKLRRFDKNSAFYQASPNLPGFSLVAAWQILSLPCVLRRNFALLRRFCQEILSTARSPLLQLLCYATSLSQETLAKHCRLEDEL